MKFTLGPAWVNYSDMMETWQIWNFIKQVVNNTSNVIVLCGYHLLPGDVFVAT